MPDNDPAAELHRRWNPAASVIVLWQGLSGNGPTAFILYATLLPAFILMTHRGNIYRLATGTERRLSKTRIRE